MNKGVNKQTNNKPELVPTTKVLQQKTFLIKFLFGIIIFLIIGLFATNKYINQQINKMKYNCTPITASKEEKELDIHSTIVQNLYNKVATNIYEDVAEPQFNNKMKLYLAYRQILETEKYDSNCNNFSPTAMEPYTCLNNSTFIPKAFKEETIKQKLKELYGENITIPLQNIRLGNTCLVGYQYIESRGEFVEGACDQKLTTSFTKTKELQKAISTRNTIILTEKVKYYTKGGMDLPATLKSGIYHYTFRLDMNYNYVLIEKSYENQY